MTGWRVGVRGCLCAVWKPRHCLETYHLRRSPSGFGSFLTVCARTLRSQTISQTRQLDSLRNSERECLSSQRVCSLCAQSRVPRSLLADVRLKLEQEEWGRVEGETKLMHVRPLSLCSAVPVFSGLSSHRPQLQRRLEMAHSEKAALKAKLQEAKAALQVTALDRWSGCLS